MVLIYFPQGLGAGGEGDDRGWDGWMASPTRWAWVWVDSESWWWAGRPGVLWFMGSQRVRHDWVTELNWWVMGKHLFIFLYLFFYLKNWVVGISLVIQWIRLWAPNAGALGLIPGQGTGSCMPQQRLSTQSLSDTTKIQCSQINAD